MTVDTAPVPPPPSKMTRRHEGGFRDTIESILIAFILAFIFRAFVVEAFVIPTGSMAPTLLGAHARFTCEDCGYQFEANYSSSDEQNIQPEVEHNYFPTPQAGVSRSDQHIDCPNCGHVLHDPTDRRRDKVPIHYGDRILVLKYSYLLQSPQRWDVVVFKAPDEPSPGASWYTTNFIKRLAGKPGETLMVLDGDVYVSTTGGTQPDDFKVQGKPRHVQDALWRVVCDGEFIPHLKRRDEPWHPWQVESGDGWNVGTPDQPQRVYTFDAPNGAGTIRFDSSHNKRRALTDFLAYAELESARSNKNVSDLKLSCVYLRKSGDGPLRLRLTKHNDAFTAELSRTAAKLFRKRGTPAGPDDLGEEIAQATSVSGLDGGPIRLDFTNVDYTVTLRVGNSDVLTTAYDPDIATLKDAYSANRQLPKPEVRITAAGQNCALSHVSLWRDVYYTTEASQIRWGRPDDPIRLGDDEYFVLGDNTVISKDARYWTEPVNLPAEDLDVQAGRVPGRFMLGKAFFVYWPAGYRPFGSPSLPGLIPNFGDMRLIH